MTNDEVMLFIQQIKKDYPKFDLTSNEYQCWHDQLTKLQKEIAEVKYEEHKKSEYKKNPPSLQIFIYKPKEELKKRVVLMKCDTCGKMLYYDAMTLHTVRHNSVNYIKSKTELLFKKEFTKDKYEELMNMNEDEFQSKYDLFLKQIVKYVSKAEQIAILNSFYLKENLGVKINVDDICKWWADKNLMERYEIENEERI